jgi:Rod binding domain-containing protein
MASLTRSTIAGPAAHEAAGRAQATLEMRRAAEEFEGVFLAQILRGLTEGLTGPGPLGAGKDDPFASMLQDEYAKLISRSGGIGVADAVLREMLRMQEVA